VGMISITSCQGLPMRDLIPLSTDKWLTNNWPMTDWYCAIFYQFFWLESLFLVILDCKSILVLLIYWFYEIFPSISIFNNVFILFFRCCCNKYVTGVNSLFYIFPYLLPLSFLFAHCQMSGKAAYSFLFENDRMRLEVCLLGLCTHGVRFFYA